MTKTLQKRTLATRSRLITAAQEIIRAEGYEAMRVEEVVRRANVAKGTFFAHFSDKDFLMDLLIGSRINEYLDILEALPTPSTPKEIANALLPIAEFMTSERYVFDVILRYSGAAAIEKIGVIAESFGRQVEILERWIGNEPMRSDISISMQAEGIHAFMLQAMALKFCALHNSQSIGEYLEPYLSAWLTPN